MNLLRRKFLKTATYVGATVTTIGTLIPQTVLGAYTKAAFEARDISGALYSEM